MSKDNMTIYEKYRNVPNNAKREIKGGRLSGMTDINPMWRIKSLTEEFGPPGIGWYIEVLDYKIEEGGNNEKVAFVFIHLYIKQDGEWSKPIFGTGGSSFIADQRNGLYTSDECFKMAYTDAISVACKALGFGADVYYEKDNTKYSNNQPKINNNNKRKLSDPQVNRLYAKANAANIKSNVVKQMAVKEFGIVELNEMTKQQYDNFCNRLDKVAEQNGGNK